MITKSNAWNTAFSQSVIYTRIEGTLTTVSGTVYTFDEDDIVPGTLSIANKCVNSQSFEYGTVYVGEMNISLKLDVDRYALYGATVILTHYLKLANNTYESTKLGEWVVDNPVRTRKIIALKCYDYMLEFDVNITSDSQGTVYNLLNLACTQCGVSLAQTDEEINALTNATQTYYCANANVATYRDLIAYLAMVTATFATINSDGHLKLVEFGKTSVKTLDGKKITSSSVADYQTFFKGIKARFIANENYATYSYNSELTSGLVLDMGDIPIVQGNSAFKNTLLANIYAELEDVMYTPCDIQCVGDVSLELGDLITIPNAYGSQTSVNMMITSLTFNNHAQQKIDSVGSNPKLAAAQTKSDRMLSGASQQMSDLKLVMYTYTNADAYTISTSDMDATSIINIECEATIATQVEFKSMILLTITATTNAVITFTYYIDDVAVTGFVPVETLGAGSHIINLYHYFEIEANSTVNFSVKASITGGSASIASGRIASSITGQGLYDDITSLLDEIIGEEI